MFQCFASYQNNFYSQHVVIFLVKKLAPKSCTLFIHNIAI